MDNLKSNLSKTVLLNVRGTRFRILKERLKNFPMISRIRPLENYESLTEHQLLMVCDRYDLDKKEFYFDRDPEVLKMLLNGFNSKNEKLHLNEDYCIFHLTKELEYWKLKNSDFDLCCRYKIKNDEEEFAIFNKKEEDFDEAKKLDEYYRGQFMGKLRRKLWDITEVPRSSWMAIVNINIINNYFF